MNWEIMISIARKCPRFGAVDERLSYSLYRNRRTAGGGYGEMWTTEDLSTVPGIILYKEYVTDINPMGTSYIEHTSSHYVEMNQKNGRFISDEEW